MKWILSTDWHFGNADNSRKHNENLVRFTQQVIDFAKENGITQFGHLGDLFHHRDKINVETINYASQAIWMLSDYFDASVFCKGNHDLLLRDSLAISSLEPFRYSRADKMVVVDETLAIDDLLFSSWVCSPEQYLRLVQEAEKYPFVAGHFEFSGFQMNDHYLMEHGLDSNALRHAKQVFSGHYHKRQHQRNVTYLGSPFPFDYNDSNDVERGFMVLDTEKQTWEFHDSNICKVETIPYEQFLSEDFEDTENTMLRIEIPETIEGTIMDKIQKKFNELPLAKGSKIDYRGGKLGEILGQDIEVSDIADIDELVKQQLAGMSPVPDIDNSLLVELYSKAIPVEG